MIFKKIIWRIEFFLQKIFLHYFVPAELQHLHQTRRDAFKTHGEGLYITIFEQPEQCNWVIRIISRRCKNLTHVACCFYYKKDQNIFTSTQRFIIDSALRKFYTNQSIREKRIKYLLLSNFMEHGGTACSLSFYNDRKIILVKPKCNDIQIKIILDFLCEQIFKPYSWINILGKFFGGAWHVPGYYDCCDEITEAFFRAGVKISETEPATPLSIYKFCKEKNWIVFTDGYTGE